MVDFFQHLSKLWNRSRVSCGSVLPFFGTSFARIPPTFFNSRTVRIKYSLTSNCFDAYSRDRTCRGSMSVSEYSQDTKRFSISLSQHHAVILTLLLSTVHHFLHHCPYSHRRLQRWCFYTCRQLCPISAWRL